MSKLLATPIMKPPKKEIAPQRARFMRFDDQAYARLPLRDRPDAPLKLEGLTPEGSIKAKTARALIADLEARGRLTPGARLIESSSGNLGVALAAVCAERSLRFTCVTDVNASPDAIAAMRAYGAELIVIDQRDSSGGFVASRVAEIQERLARDPQLIWTNQYANPANPAAHEATTAKEISDAFPTLDYLFVGVGTGGTAMGCKRFFAAVRPSVSVVGVDTVGSVTFGGAPGKRFIPGLGNSRRPEIVDPIFLQPVVMSPEAEAVIVCRWLARETGLMLGGSTGSVVAGMLSYLRDHKPPSNAALAAISPDMGDKYLSSIYNDAWVIEHFGKEPLERCRRETLEEALGHDD